MLRKIALASLLPSPRLPSLRFLPTPTQAVATRAVGAREDGSGVRWVGVGMQD